MYETSLTIFVFFLLYWFVFLIIISFIFLFRHYLFYYHIFGLLWTAAFFMAALNFILSSATSQWYFAETVNGEKDLNFPVVTGVKRAFGIHGGTMVFGSFLVAVFESIRMIVVSKHKAKERHANGAL